MKKIRIGVTGSGFMGRTHVDATAKIDEAEPAAVTGGRRADRLAKDYEIDCVADVAALVSRDDVDAIVIATPHHVHAAEAVAAAEAGKHVLVEKPLATTLADCRRIIDACRDNNVTLSIGYHQRFRRSNQTARELIRSGAIGPVRCIQTSALFDVGPMRKSDSGFGGNWSWWNDPQSLGHILNSGPHNIDLIRWWTGAEPVSVTAHCGTFREENNPNENTTMALLQFSNGAICTFWSSSVLPAPGFAGEGFRFRIMGDDGVLDIDPYDEVRVCRDGKWETAYKQPPVDFSDTNSAFQMSRMQAYCDQMRAFVQSIGGKQGGEGDAADGLAGVAAVLAMLRSSADGRVIRLEDFTD